MRWQPVPEETKQALRAAYEAGVSMYKLCPQYRMGFRRLRNIIVDGGIPIRGVGPSRKWSITAGYFHKINTEEKAYWLGFFTADGNVHDGRIRLSLATKDRSHVEAFALAIGCDIPLKEYDCGTVGIDVRCAEMVRDLAKYGVVPNKSKVTVWPVGLPRPLEQHFVRGVVDGDGSFHYRNANKSAYFNVTGSVPLITVIAKWLREHAGVNGGLRPHHKSLSYTCGGNVQVQSVHRLLYNRSHVALGRKKRFLDDHGLRYLKRAQGRPLSAVHGMQGGMASAAVTERSRT